MSATEAAEPTAAAAPAPRRIPGLSVPSTAPQQAPKPRKRSSKHKVPLAGALEPSATLGTQDSSLDKREAAIAEVPVEDDDLVVEEKKTNAVEACHKRIRATTKKLQRIEGYEASVGTLNADQQRAIQGKPALEAVARELNELLVILKAEEAQDEERNKRVAAVEEKKQSRAIDAAVQVAKTEAQQHLSLLFQFLRLHALYNPAESAFAPPILPPIVANANGSDVAVVRMLFDAFSNGPLLGADDGALERLAKIFDGRDEEVLPGTGVTYARIRELVHGLTAPPEDARAAPEPTDAVVNESVEDLVAQSNEPAAKADSVVALVDGATEEVHPPVPQSSSAPAPPSFMQPSEVEAGTAPQDVATPPADEKVQHWAQDIALEAQAPPPSGPSTPAPDASFGRDTPSTSVPTTPTSIAAPPIAPNGFAHLEQPQPQSHQQSQPTLDWAAEDDGDGGLPHLDELAPPVPVVSLPAPSSTAAQPGTPAGSSDGFQPARQPRRTGTGQGGAPRGGHRGGRGGFFRGARRGGPGGPGGEGRSESFQRREGGQHEGGQQEGGQQQQHRGPRPPRFEHRGESGAGNGEGKPHGGPGVRGGRGRGGGPRGRGGRGGANGNGVTQGAGAAAGGAAAGQAAPAVSA
ncbi:hypothetical protein JCM3775_001790 [Rhodotorula graminis]